MDKTQFQEISKTLVGLEIGQDSIVKRLDKMNGSIANATKLTAEHEAKLEVFHERIESIAKRTHDLGSETTGIALLMAERDHKATTHFMESLAIRDEKIAAKLDQSNKEIALKLEISNKEIMEKLSLRPTKLDLKLFVTGVISSASIAIIITLWILKH